MIARVIIFVFLCAVAAASQDREPLLSIAREQLIHGRIAECQRTLDGILLFQPRDTAAWKLKSDAYYLSGEDVPAEECLRKAIAIEPRNPELHYALGRIYYQQSRPEPAIAQFDEVLKLDPASYKAYDNLGLCYQALNREAEAIHSFLKALDLVHEKHRDYEWPYANLANLLIQRGEYEKAFALAAEAAERNPRSARNLYLTGKALVKLEKPGLGVRWLKRATELDPDYPEAHYLLARTYRKLGQSDEGTREMRLFVKARAKVPQNRR